MPEVIRAFRHRYPGGPVGAATPYENLVFKDTLASRALNTTPWDTCPTVAFEDPGLIQSFYDDFFTLNTTTTSGNWQVVKGTGGSLALATTAGGWANIPTAASANDYQMLASQSTAWLLRANKPLWFEISLSLTEAATNAASWFAGFSSVTTNGFISNAGAPPASYSGAIFYKTTGAMAVNFQTSNGSTQNGTSTLFTATSGTNYILGAYLNPNDGTTALVQPYVSSVTNGVITNIISAANTAPLNLAIGSLANMYFVFGVKAGSSSAETLSVDFAQIAGYR